MTKSKNLRAAQEHLKIVNLGATAIGTTVTAAPGYPELAVKNLAELTGIDFKNSEDLGSLLPATAALT